MVRIAIVQYSTYGHITVLAKEIQRGVLEADPTAVADIYQIPETLSEDVLAKIHAPAKPADIPIATPETLTQYDAFLFGLPTRFGTLPAQWAEFWGQTGGLWASGALHGKPAGLFVSTGTPGGGQEATLRNILSILVHHGIIYVPLGYKNTFPELTNIEEPHGGSPWGSGVFADADGSRQASELELKIVYTQGAEFAKTVSKFGSSEATTTAAPAPAPAPAAAPAAAAETTTKPAVKEATRSTERVEKAEEAKDKCCVVM